MRVLPCLLVLGFASGARAQQEPEDTDAPETESTVTAPASTDAEAAPPWKTRFGARLVTGAPEGVSVEALIHPRPWLRAHVGGSRNRLGSGVRGGLSLIPLELFVQPSLELEYGHTFKADYNELLTQLHGQPTTATTDIREVDYDQLSASVGLEVSPWRYVTFFGGVGISYWFIGVPGVKSFIRESETNPDLTAEPLTIGLSSPVAKLGLIVYFN